jgi:hypothetical protein
MDNEQALALLEIAIHERGALQVLTNAHLCGVYTPKTSEEQEACALHAYPLTDPRHFLRLDVVHVTEPTEKGVIRAYAEDGSYTQGYPVDVFRRLREAAVAAQMPDPINSDPAPGYEMLRRLDLAAWLKRLEAE